MLLASATKLGESGVTCHSNVLYVAGMEEMRDTGQRKQCYCVGGRLTEHAGVPVLVFHPAVLSIGVLCVFEVFVAELVDAH